MALLLKPGEILRVIRRQPEEDPPFDVEKQPAEDRSS
jgi:hypothetical protein